MSTSSIIFGTENKKFIDGYSDDSRNASLNTLTPPSININLTKTGEAVTRGGYIDTGIALAEANKDATSFYMEEYDITFFAVGTKIKYYEWANDVVIDTGITITDTITRFTEYNGVVYATNTTDGCYAILVTRLNGAVADTDTTIETDVSGAAMAKVLDAKLSLSVNDLRIEGTDEEYDTITISGGVFDLTTAATASQAYSDNAIAIVTYNLTSIVPKASKMFAWKESLNAIGVGVDNENQLGDRSQTTLYFSQFATAATAEASFTWSGGTAGSELVGKSGTITNAIATRDYMYIFKENETHWIAVSGVNASTGARPPQLLSSVHGCINEDCAADLGNGTIAFLTPNNRIIAIRIETDNGAAVVFPDESFDTPIRNLLEGMDLTQANPRMYYSRSKKRLFVELDIDGSKLTLKYNNEIGKWEPPNTGWAFRSMFERKGVLYATSTSDDTIYEMGVGYQDEGQDIDFVAASTLIEFEDGRSTLQFREIETSGRIGENTTVTSENIVNEGTPQEKTFDASGLSFSRAKTLGSVTLGDSTVENGEQVLASWDHRFGIYPTYGSSYQHVLSAIQPFTWTSYRLKAAALSTSLLTLK